MIVQAKIINYHGANSSETFASVREFKKCLNSMLYYCNEVILYHEGDFSSSCNYSETNDIASLVTDANFYGVELCVSPQIV
jgi:hypothetical protein